MKYVSTTCTAHWSSPLLPTLTVWLTHGGDDTSYLSLQIHLSRKWLWFSSNANSVAHICQKLWEILHGGFLFSQWRIVYFSGWFTYVRPKCDFPTKTLVCSSTAWGFSHGLESNSLCIIRKYLILGNSILIAVFVFWAMRMRKEKDFKAADCNRYVYQWYQWYTSPIRDPMESCSMSAKAFCVPIVSYLCYGFTSQSLNPMECVSYDVRLLWLYGLHCGQNRQGP